ncbi:MAG: endolytic transglycosylase MltG [Lachnospiraceae bacterium]|nr:endolytic transglycosylase MltG [Lachnospiraceae bacterium]
MSDTTKKKKKKKKDTSDMVRKGLKRSSGFTWGLLVNLVIVFLVIKAFSFSFNFAYSVFGDVCADPLSREYKVIEIPADSTILEIGEALEESQIIEDKYVFYVKVKVKGYGDKIKSGKYGLSASMSYEEILDIICNIDTEEEEE